MTQEQEEQIRNQLTRVTVARKRLVEVAAWLDRSSEIKGNDPFVAMHDLAALIRKAVENLDFALDQFESFITPPRPLTQEQIDLKNSPLGITLGL